MTFLILLETLRTIKNQGGHATETHLEMLSTKVRETYGADGVRLLHQVLVGLGLKHEEQDFSMEVLPHENSSRYAGFYTHSLYKNMLPLCQLAYLSEKNGIAEEHAYKLATLFSNEQDVLLYLMQFNQENSSRYLLHDACLFELPEPENCDFAQWRRLAQTHLTNPRFRELLPHAQALEKIGNTGKYHEKRTLDRNVIKQQKEALAHIAKQYKNWDKKPAAHLNEAQRSERQEKLNQLSKDKAEQRRKLATLCKGVSLGETDMLVLEAFYEYYQNDQETHQLLIKNGINPQNIALFNTLKPANDDKVIPNLIIDGQELGYPGIYLKKLDVLSDKGKTLAVCLGKITNCCQYLGGSGHECAIHGVTSLNGGFYVVFQGDPTNPSLDDPILAQSWVWKGQENGLCLDSIETAPNNSGKHQSIIDLFRLLGHKLCHEFGISQVNTGAYSGITNEVALQNYPTEKEHFLDYTGHCDSRSQLTLAKQTMPYLFYGQGSLIFQNKIAQETQRFFNTLFSAQDALKDNKALQLVIAFALYTKRENLLDLLQQAAASSNRQKELETLIDVNKKYSEQLNSETIDIALIKQGAYVDALNYKRQSAMHLAILDEDIETFKSLMKQNPNINIQDKYGDTVLLVALKQLTSKQVNSKTERDIITQLIKTGADLDLKDTNEVTALMIAVKSNELAIVTNLVEHGADIEAFDDKMKTALFWAVENGNISVFKYLLNQGANLNIISRSRDNLLTFAALHKNQEVIKLLHASSYCNPKVMQQQNEYGNNTLLLAAKNELPETIQIILSSPHCSPELLQQYNNNGENILICALQKNLTKAIKTIFENRHGNLELLLQQQDKYGSNALIWAAKEANTEAVEAIMVSPYCTPDLLQQQNKYGSNALIEAAMNGHSKIVKVILSSPHCCSEMLRQQDYETGNNALIWAAKKGHTETVQAILSSLHCTSDVLTQQNRDGFNALSWAISMRQTETVQTILSSPKCRSEALSQHDKYGYNALIWATQRGHTKLIQAIITSPNCSLELLTSCMQQKNDGMITLKPEIQGLIEMRIELLQKEEQNKINNSSIHPTNNPHCFFNMTSNKDEIESPLCTANPIQAIHY